MGFISATASKVASGGGTGTGGYLTASKLGDGEHHRIAIVSESPLEYWTVWGESEEGQKKPFRFAAEPSQSDIESELGDFKQRMNYEGTALEAPKFGLSFFCFDYADSKIKVFEITQKDPDQGTGQALAGRGLCRHPRLGSQSESHWSQDEHGVQHPPLPSQEGQRRRDQSSLERSRRSWLRSPATLWWAAILSVGILKRQVDLVDQVMRDRSITSRAGPALVRQRLRELGLPEDANVGTLMTLWRLPP